MNCYPLQSEATDSDIKNTQNKNDAKRQTLSGEERERMCVCVIMCVILPRKVVDCDESILERRKHLKFANLLEQ